MDQETPTLPFGSFHGELDTVATAVKNKIRLQWPNKWNPPDGAPTALQASVAVAQNTYRTIVFICSEEQEAGRRLEFSLSCTPLLRTILDSVFSIVYLLQDVPVRTTQFYRGGWREMREELDRYSGKYGTDPNWSEWIAKLTGVVDGLKADLGISPAEEANLRKAIQYWPIPSQMLRDSGLDTDRRTFLEYLTDWFYRELSADSHLSMTGLARRSVALLEDKTECLIKHRSDCVMVAAILLLALLSEIQLEAQWPDIKPRLEYVWTILGSLWDVGKEIYDMRYAGRL
jgi:hypothetical protein